MLAFTCVCVDICMFIQQDCEILITVNSSSVHLLLWKYLFHVHTPFKNYKLFWGSCHQLLHRCLVQCLEHAGQALNKWVKLECLYIIFFFRRSVAVFSWNIEVFLLLYIDCNFVEARLWGWKRQICELEKKECVSVREDGRGRSRDGVGSWGAVKRGRVKPKLIINHLKIICPKMLGTLNASLPKFIYFWFTF